MGRKKLYKNRIYECVIKEQKEAGFDEYHFKDLPPEEIPNEKSVGSFVHYAPEVYRGNYTVYQLIGFEYKNDKLFFKAAEFDGPVRFFYQNDICVIPDTYLHRKYKHLSTSPTII